MHALYFLDPPPCMDSGINLISDLIQFSLKWAGDAAESDKRIRLYQRIPWPSHMKLLGGSLSLSGSEPPEPFVRNSTDGKRTLSVVSSASWKRTVAKILGSSPSYKWDDFNEPHHLIAATMLTHALAQDKDLF